MKIKLIFGIFTLISFFFGKAFAQNENVYKKAILYHFSNVNIDTIYVLKCSDIELPSEIGKYKIVELNNILENIKGKDNLYAVKLMPIQLNKGNAEVVLIDYLIEIKASGEINLNNSGTDIYTFRYDAKVKSYKLVKRKKDKV